MIASWAPAIAVCGGASIFLLALSAFPAESPLAARLKKMERVTERSISGRISIIEQMISEERHSRLQSRLIEAGWYRVSPFAMALRSLAALDIGAVIGLGMLFLLLRNETLGIAFGLLSALVAWRIPSIMLSQAIKTRKLSIQRDLPDFLDMLAATVQAGLALNPALIRAVDVTSGPLKDELQSMLSEMRLGRPRADAFNAMAQRVNEESITTMVTAIVQAERLGSNLSQVLQEVAKDTRDRRWLLAEERASQLPIKMIIPMALFMIPSLYLMIFGPVIARMAAPHQ